MLNKIIKVVCFTMIISQALSIGSQYSDMVRKNSDLKNWENIKDYGVFYPVSNGFDGDEVFGRESLFEFTSRDQLYFLLNGMGAILIHTKEYEQNSLRLNINWQGIRSIKVNNNYLLDSCKLA